MSTSRKIKKLAKGAKKNSKRWFPEIFKKGTTIPLCVHLGMGVGGEAGEVVDLLKKVTREGGLDVDHLMQEMPGELADVFTYVLLLADELDIDIVQAFHNKQAECEERWG